MIGSRSVHESLIHLYFAVIFACMGHLLILNFWRILNVQDWLKSYLSPCFMSIRFYCVQFPLIGFRDTAFAYHFLLISYGKEAWCWNLWASVCLPPINPTSNVFWNEMNLHMGSNINRFKSSGLECFFKLWIILSFWIIVIWLNCLALTNHCAFQIFPLFIVLFGPDWDWKTLVFFWIIYFSFNLINNHLKEMVRINHLVPRHHHPIFLN